MLSISCMCVCVCVYILKDIYISPFKTVVMHIYIKEYTGWGKSRFTVVSTWNTEFIPASFFNYCIFHMNKCKPTFAPPCVVKHTHVLFSHSFHILVTFIAYKYTYIHTENMYMILYHGDHPQITKQKAFLYLGKGAESWLSFYCGAIASFI